MPGTNIKEENYNISYVDVVRGPLYEIKLYRTKYFQHEILQYTHHYNYGSSFAGSSYTCC